MLAIILALLITSSRAATSPSPYYNPFIRGGKNDVYLNSDSSRGLASYTFTVPFVHVINPTINPVLEVFYSIEDIQAQLLSALDPTDSRFINMEYAFSTPSISFDHMITAIEAYLYIPFFRKFTFRYLLIQNGDAWRGTHLVCQSLKLANTAKVALLPLPSLSTSASTLFEAYFLSSIKIRFLEDDLTDTDVLQVDWSSVRDASGANIQFSLIVPQFVDDGTFVISYIGLVIDRTSVQRDFINYKFKAGYYSFSGIASPSLTYFTSVEAQEYHFFGLSWLDFKLKNADPSFDLTLTESYPSIRMEFLGRNFPYTNSFAYSYFYFVRMICKSGFQPIYDNVTLNCIICSGRTYLNASLVACLPCRYDCLTCNSHYQCTTCDSAAFRVLSTDFSCSPRAGYYQTNQTIAQPCLSPCFTCINSASECTSCIGTTALIVAGSCVPCSAKFQGCSDCHQAYCISCSAGYTQINSTYCNLPCSDSNCLICKNNDTTSCQLCLSPLKLTSNKCLQVEACGNGFLEGVQGCDDGNFVLKDGCDDSCMPEPNYNCYSTTVSGKTFTTYCAYTKAIDFTILSTEKLPLGNIIQLVLEVKDYQQSFWKNTEVLNCWFIDNIRYTGMSGRYLQQIEERHNSKLLTPKLSSYSLGSLVYLQFEYLESLQNKLINLKFDASGSFHSILVEIPASMKSLIVIPENNHYAYLYSQDIYSRQQLLSNLFLGLSVVSFFLLLVSLIMGNKRIVAEYIVLLQIGYASLITLPGYNGMDYSLVSLRAASNGFNILEGSAIRPFQDQLSNERIKGMYAYSQFIYNVNFGLVFIIIPLIVGTISCLLSCFKSFKEETIKSIEKVRRLSLGQYTFTGLIVGGCSIGLASGIELQYGKQEIATFLALISFALPFLLLPLFLIYSIVRFKKPEFFGQYQQQLSLTRSSLIFQISNSLIGVVSGLVLAYLYSASYANFIVIALCALLFVVSLGRRQFKKGLDSFRTQFNLISLIIIQLPFAYTNYYGVSKYSSQDDVMILLPVCIGVVLSIGLILNLTFFAYQIIKKFRLYLTQKEQPQQKNKEEKSEDKAEEKAEEKAAGAAKDIIAPLKLKSGKFRKGFIETETEEQYLLQKTAIKDYNILSIDFEQCKFPNSILRAIKPTNNNQAIPQQQACMGTIQQKKFILSTIYKMDGL